VEKYPKKIVLIEDNVKCGSATSNFMQLAHHATAEYVMFCDQDDYWLPNKVEVSLNGMIKAEQEVGSDVPILVFAKYKAVDKDLQDIGMSDKGTQLEKRRTELNHLIVQNCVHGCLSMVNRALYSIMGDYDKDILMHDWWAALIASSMGKIVYIPEALMLYRQHGSNVVGAVKTNSFKYRWAKFTDKNTKNMKFRYRDQMTLFYQRYRDILPKEANNCISDFLSIYDTKSKIQRMYKLSQGQYLKSDMVRILGQMWYI
jgi:glycosyltransferase involved in cell wall biosynthesis